MAEAGRTGVAFEGLQLNSFPQDWVKKCWDEDFIDLNSLPFELEDLFKETDYLTNELEILGEVLGLWVESNNLNEDEEGFWSVLVENNVPHKTLVALLAFLCHNASKVSITFTERLAGTQAASIYLRLAALPGSSAFKIFHPELFLQACRLLTKWNKRDCEGPGQKKRRRSNTPLRSSQRGKRRKGGKKRFNESSLESMEEDADDDDDSFSEEEFMKLDLCMRQLLVDVLLMCEKFSLRQSESTASQLMTLLVGLLRLAPESVVESMGQWDHPRCSVGMLSYKAMFMLCQPFHGHVISMANEACKLLLNHILMLEDGKFYPNLLRSIIVLKQQAVAFILYLVQQLGERCLPCVKTLLQHICFKVPDKSEYRTHVAKAVCELLVALPDNDYASFLEWLKKFSKHKKVSHRSFSIDIMLALIEKPERHLTDVPEELASFTAHKSMVCTLLSRCSDSHASVRSRALVAFSQCTNSKHTGVVSTIKDVITPINLRARPTAKHFMPTPCVNLLTDSEVGTSGSTSEVQSDVESVANKDSDVFEDQENVPDNESVKTNGKSSSCTPQGARDGKRFMSIALTPSFNPYLPDTEGVVSMMRRRALDSKVVVRKSALQALQQIIQFEAPSFSQEDLSMLRDRCADPALSVRKQASQSLFEVLQAFPHDQNIQKAWVFGLLPQVMDRESSVQEKCFDTLEEMIISNLKPAGRLSATGIEWHILTIIADDSHEKLRRYLQKACQYWARTKKLKPSVVIAVQSHVMTERDNTAWMFLAEIAKTSAKLDHDFVIDHWFSHCGVVVDPDRCAKWCNVLFIIAACAKSILPETVSKLVGGLKGRLLKFSHPTSIIAAMVNTIAKLKSQQRADTNQRSLQAWGEELMSACDTYMSKIILNSAEKKGHVEDEEKLILYMFTLGEVCQRCPSRMPKRVTLIIQSIIAAPCIGDSDTPASSQAGHDSSGESSHGSQEVETGRGDDVQESQDSQPSQDSQKSQETQVSQSTQGSSASSQSQATSTQSTQPLSQFRGSNLSSKLRAHAFITLGKLCLIDETLAKKTVAALARELEESDSPAVRNNVVIVMGDLTVRYTTLVDRYITNIAACLKDTAALVRKNTLTVLTRLLQEEYVKWKGVLFFRYITTLLDENEEIKTLAEFCLEHLLLRKHPNMFFHPFIECIFHFNHYTQHPVYNKFKQTDGEKCKFTLAGHRQARRRMRLYTFMLEHMTDEQRFKTTAKICKEILSTIVEETIPLDEEGSLLLRDALDILSSKEIKLSSLRNKGTEDTVEEGANVTQIVTAAAKKVLITQVVKRNVIENIVPVVISLKHMLEKKCSPILKNLMGYLRELMKDYKSDVKDILSADKQLAEEIEFDLKNFEKQQAEKEAATSRLASPRASKASTPIAQAHGPLAQPPSGSQDASVRIEERVLMEASKHLNKPSDDEEERLDEAEKVSNVQRRRSSISEAAKIVITRTEERRGKDLRKSVLERAQKESAQNMIRTSSTNLFSSCQSSPSRSETTPLTPTASNQGRAISTPSRDLYNITFRGDGDVTMCPPPSPIPSVASAVSGGQLCMSPQVKLQKKGNKDVISMPHPNSKDPEPSKWNIQSPTAKKSAEPKKDEEGTPTKKSYESEKAGLRKSSRNRK